MRGGAEAVTGRLLGVEAKRGTRRKMVFVVVLSIYLFAQAVLLMKLGETAYDRIGGFVVLGVVIGLVALALQAKPVRIYENGLEYGHVLKSNFVHWNNFEDFEDMEEHGFVLRFHDPNIMVSLEGMGEPKMIIIGRSFPNYQYVKEYVRRKVEPPEPIPIPIDVRN